MAINWPIAVCNADILDNGYLPYQGGNTIHTENENGPSQVRCKYTAVSWFHPVNLKFTPAEYAAFRAFVNTNLRYGTLTFYFPLPTKDNPLVTANALCRFSFSDGAPPYRITKINAEVCLYVSFLLEEFAS